MDSRRAESFSDGVFAVAITILVFDLLPIGKDRVSGHILLHAWPQYAAYVVSFLTIGIMWMNHHTMLSLISRVNRPLLAINLFLLMGVVAIPFPTALVAEHLTGDAAQSRVAAFFYGLVMIAISVGFGSMWIYASLRRDLLGAPARIRTTRASTIRFTAGNGAYVAGTLVALVSAPAALILFGLIAVYYLFEHLPGPDDTGDRDDQAGLLIR
ncbi:MAG TPA: TMEM175 family protein [Streptosporangiaceae bacterium]